MTAIHGSFTVFNQTQPRIYLKNCVLVSYEEFFLTLILFLRLRKFQFANNRVLFFTIHS